MKKMKTKNIFIILGIVFVGLIIILLVYFNFFNLSILPSHNCNAGTRLVEETDSYFLFEHTISCSYPGDTFFQCGAVSCPFTAGCSTRPTVAEFYHISFIPQFGKFFGAEISTVNVKGYEYPAHRDKPLVPIYFENLQAECALDSSSFGSYEGTGYVGPYVGTFRPNLNCQISGTAEAVDGITLFDFGSYTGVLIRVKIPIQGIECLDDSYCAKNEECISNICRAKIIIEPPIPPPRPLIFQWWDSFWNFIKSIFGG